MRGNTKKFALKVAVAAAATAAMVVPMAACGSGTAGGGKTKISFYSYFKDNQIGEVVKGFEKKNPDITLDVQYGQDPAQYISTLQTRLAGGKPPTIFNLTMDNRTDVMKSGAVGLVQAILVVSIVWFFAYFISRRLGVDQRSAMILSSGVSICGVSACITAARVAGGDDKKLSYIVSLVLIIVVPMIYMMPWLAHLLLPVLFDDPQVIQEVAGAWIGGTIDTTSGVAASSAIVSELSNQHAVIIKGAQNVLIGFVAFFIALYLSTRGEKGSNSPSLGIVWEKFPKFIIGFVAASLVFSIFQANDLFLVNEKGKLIEPGIAKMFSTVFFSLAFVCVGLETQIKDIVSRENRNVMWSFLTAQTFNILVTFIIACLLFGIVKPMLG